MKPGITTGTGGHRPQHLCVQGRAGDLKGSDAGNSAGVKPEPGRLRSGQFFAEVQSNRRRLADAEAEEGWRVHKVQLEDTASWNFLKNYISDSKMALHTWMPPSLLPLPRPPSPPPLPCPARGWGRGGRGGRGALSPPLPPPLLPRLPREAGRASMFDHQFLMMASPPGGWLPRASAVAYACCLCSSAARQAGDAH